jgi:triphosphoribosyl-dephospho-CoA synthetase
MKLTPQDIRKLAEIAFVLEPILDKKGCTTRYQDIDGLPLSDFLIAAVNIGPIIEEYAASLIEDDNTMIFSHFAKAILASNDYKSKKFITTGLLHFLFITIKVRLASSTIDEALGNYQNITRNSTKEDVQQLLNGFEIGWSTTKKDKQDVLEKRREIAENTHSYYEFQKTAHETVTPEYPSAFHITHQIIHDFPIIKEFVQNIDEKKGLIVSIENTYNNIHERDPSVKVGILADFSASALFLYLSFQDPKNYTIS